MGTDWCGGPWLPNLHTRLQSTHKPHTTTTGKKPLTSPATNLVIDAAQAIIAPNVLARSQVLDYKAAKTKVWEAVQQQWAEWAEGKAGQG